MENEGSQLLYIPIYGYATTGPTKAIYVYWPDIAKIYPINSLYADTTDSGESGNNVIH